MTELPPYSADPPTAASEALTNNRIAGIVNTISITDLQSDYFRVIRESPTSYFLNLTVDPTPIFRIELPTDPSALGDILIFPAFSSSSDPIAAARLTKNPKRSDPIAQLCTASPHLSNAKWRPILKAPPLSYGADYKCSIPIITVPGSKPIMKEFTWQTKLPAPYYQLWWDGAFPSEPEYQHSQRAFDARSIFATFTPKSVSRSPENLIRLRRGGGLEFELSVVLGMIAIFYHVGKKQL